MLHAIMVHKLIQHTLNFDSWCGECWAWFEAVYYHCAGAHHLVSKYQ